MTLTIYVDFAMPADAFALLKEGTRKHELLLPESPAASVLDQSECDPRFAMADIAFGQPDPASINKATKLKWIHVSTSGITRYDTPEFRRLLSERNIAMSNSASVYAEACAVHALSFILAQARQLPAGLVTRTEGGTDKWLELRSRCSTLRGQTVVIVGYGAIGKRLTGMPLT
ncbi:MAG: hypothetical protein KJ626_11125 [Verrucomicrobia bacterium]|nr:hypothetical protein [Verrucomicrobiota bacterium]